MDDDILKGHLTYIFKQLDDEGKLYLSMLVELLGIQANMLRRFLNEEEINKLTAKEAEKIRERFTQETGLEAPP